MKFPPNSRATQPANVQWVERVRDLAHEVLVHATTPGFTGSVSLEVHSSDGVIRQCIKQSKEHCK